MQHYELSRAELLKCHSCQFLTEMFLALCAVETLLMVVCVSLVDNTTIALSLMGTLKGSVAPQKTGDLNIVLSGMSISMGTPSSKLFVNPLTLCCSVDKVKK